MKPQIFGTATVIAVLLAVQLVSAQNRTTPASFMGIDPAAGKPSPPPIPESTEVGWKDPKWIDPDIVLTNINWREGLPLSEVTRYICESFHNQFDIITPVNWGSGYLPVGNEPMQIDPRTHDPVRLKHLGSQPIDLSTIEMRLELHNVTASELFNAMNLIFENDRAPLRWELKLNGKRQVALLKVLSDPIIENVPDPEPEMTRHVYYVGDLIGSEKNGGMTMEQIIQTVNEVWKMTYHGSAGLQFHKDAQLLIVSGTVEQINFVEDILNALKQKAATAKKEADSAKDDARVNAVKDAMAKQMIDNTKTTNLKPAAK
ncbi:MAG TPA: hypothetical protein VN625_10945 [Desulfuromonadaceae bacterium]|nr:hypothetical protein [Desulfuromonadaceae bacterium]